MKQLLISVLSLGLVLSIWAIFIYKSDSYLSNAVYECENEILPLIEEDNWGEAYKKITGQYKSWNHYKKYAFFFYDSKQINDTDCTFLKTIMYIKAKDLSNGSGELRSLSAQLYSIVQNDKVSWKNIV